MKNKMKYTSKPDHQVCEKKIESKEKEFKRKQDFFLNSMCIINILFLSVKKKS